MTLHRLSNVKESSVGDRPFFLAVPPVVGYSLRGRRAVTVAGMVEQGG